jgi:hypothetical protein
MRDKNTAFEGAGKAYEICYIPVEFFLSIFYGCETWSVTVMKDNE